MTKVIGLYLHGFLSSGNSEKGQWFKSQSLTEYTSESGSFLDWVTPTYPIGSVALSVSTIRQALEGQLERAEAYEKTSGEACKVVLLGSSMGGFYAQYFAYEYGLPFVMINPALNPKQVFIENMGVHINPATDETVEINADYINQVLGFQINLAERGMKNSSPKSLLLLDLDDEIIDVQYALQYYPISKVGDNNSVNKTVTFTGGDHSFIHLEQAWEEILKFIKCV